MTRNDNTEITILIDEQARDSDSLLDAFNELFVSISESMPSDELVKTILRLRRARTVFERSRQRLSLVDNKIIKGHLNSIALSKKYLTIAECERLLDDWMAEIAAVSHQRIICFLVSGLPALFDPETDILICSGANSAENTVTFLGFGFKRVFSCDALVELIEKGSASAEEKKLDDFIADIPNLEILPPRICSAFHQDESAGRSDSIVAKEKALTALRNSLMRVLSTRSTLNKFGDLWSTNAIKNRVDWKSYKDLESLRNIFPDSTIYVVGPAPSLDKKIAELKEAAKSGVVICVSQALRKLRDHGIVPHFVVITDALYMPDDFSCGLSGVLGYVFDIVTDPRQRPDNTAMLFPYVSSALKREAYMDLWGREITQLQSWGSVSHSAISLARLLGARRIALVGHDFCFSEGRQYSLLKSGIATTYEMDESSKGRLFVKTYAGSLAKTKLDYDMFRVAVGEMAKAAKKYGVSVVNTSVDAAMADGVDLVSIPELMNSVEALPDFTNINASEVKDLIAPSLLVDVDKLESLRRIVRRGISEFARCERDGVLSKEVVVALDAAREHSSGLPCLSMLIQERLSKVDERLMISHSLESRNSALFEFLKAFDSGLEKYQESISEKKYCFG